MFRTLLNFLGGIEIFMTDETHVSGGPLCLCARQRATLEEGLGDRHRVGFPCQAQCGEKHSSRSKYIFYGTSALR